VFGKTNTTLKINMIVTQLKCFLGLWAWLVGVAAAVGNETCTCQIWSRVLSECSSGPCEQRLQAASNCS
jgi:hypothetical protein